MYIQQTDIYGSKPKNNVETFPNHKAIEQMKILSSTKQDSTEVRNEALGTVPADVGIDDSLVLLIIMSLFLSGTEITDSTYLTMLIFSCLLF